MIDDYPDFGAKLKAKEISLSLYFSLSLFFLM